MNRPDFVPDYSSHARGLCSLPIAKLLILIMAVAAVGCAHQFPEYPARPCSKCSMQCSGSGITLGVEPIFDASTSREYFDVDMMGRGILPVYVVVENQSRGRTLLVSREQFEIVGANAASDKNEASNSTPGAVVAWTGAIVGSVPGLMLGASMVADSENVKTNYDRKALQSQTVSPGNSTSGFVFFKIPAGERPKEWRLRAELRDINQVTVDPIVVIITNPGR